MTETRDHSDRIAVIGMSGRFPMSEDLDTFWANIRDGLDCVTRFSDAELARAGIPPSIYNHPHYVKAGSVLERVAGFDAPFFGMSRAEAEIADPQQRIMLECAWEAFENAGYHPETLDMPVGVFCGSNISTYLLYNLMPDRGFTPEQSLPLALGNSRDYIATLISYKLNLKGPGMCVQTACSTSLVAIHLACQSLLSGETDLALAGGIAVRLPRVQGYYYREGDIASPDGKTRSFDEAGSGTLFGSGAGAVLLKRLDDAIEDGDCIDAVILGSALNNDGSVKIGFSAPSADGQVAAVGEALAMAGIHPETVTLIEAHGTATGLGDPIELSALNRVFRAETAKKGFCAIGSVKSNLGHLETAAGMAGLIKTVLALKNKTLPPTIHVRNPTAKFDFGSSPFYLNTSAADWNVSPRRAGVSSFGMGGTNAHLVLEEAPAREPVQTRHRGALLLPLSARCPGALRDLARAWRELLPGKEPTMLADLVWSACLRRGHHDHRLAVTGPDTDTLAARLDAFLRNVPAEGVAAGNRNPDRETRTVFLFPGQGSQWIGMGRELMEREEVFRASIEKCERAMRPFTDWSLIEQLQAPAETSLLNGEVDVIQPALFAMQISLAELWRHYGVEPDAVVGHSMGEAAAAYVAGALSLEDAARIICLRSKLVKKTSGKGAMALVALSPEETKRDLTSYGEDAVVAAINGPSTVLVSATLAAMDRLFESWSARDVFCRRVKVDYASHCPQMDSILSELREILKPLAPRDTATAIFSTVRGRLIDGSVMDADYWAENLRKPVLFYNAIRDLVGSGYNTFIEVSPHPITVSAVSATLDEAGADARTLCTVERDKSEWVVFLNGLGELYARGADLDWDALFPEGGNFVRLPNYPWQRKDYWIGGQGTGYDLNLRDYRGSSRNKAAHPYLGTAFESSLDPGTRFWNANPDPASRFFAHLPRWEGTPLFSAGVQTAMMLQAAGRLHASEGLVLRELLFGAALFLAEGVKSEIQIAARESVDNPSLLICSCRTPDGKWRRLLECASGPESPREPEKLNIAAINERCMTVLSGPGLADRIREAGFTYKSAGKLIREARLGENEIVARLALPGDLEWEPDRCLPLLLEAGFQVLLLALPATRPDGEPAGYGPVTVREIRLEPEPERAAWIHLRLSDSGQKADLIFCGEMGGPVLVLNEICPDSMSGEDRAAAFDQARCFYELDWERAALLAANADRQSPGTWVLLAGEHPVSDRLRKTLTGRGDRCIVLAPGERFEAAADDFFRADPMSPGDFREFFEQARLGGSFRGIVHLWSLETSTETGDLEHSLALGCASALHLVQAAVALNRRNPTGLWIVTSSTQPVEGQPANPLQAALWGLGKNIACEHRELVCSMIDLGPEPDAAEIDALVAELSHGEPRAEIALRGDSRFLARLVRPEPRTAASGEPLCRPDRTYLITGGLGEMGLQTASRLVRNGAKSLALLGRREPGPDVSARVDEWRAQGVETRTFIADAADFTALKKVFASISRDMSRLAGVIHLAGVLDDRLLVLTDWQSFRAVTRPKLDGAWHLHHLAAELPLDFFVLFSSAVSLLGSHGQAGYVAANQFLDTLAHHRRGLGLPALSVNWGGWAEIGKAARIDPGDLRVRLFPPDHGFAALERLLRENAVSTGFIAGFDTNRWFRATPHAARFPLFRDMAAPVSAESEWVEGDLRERIEEASEETRAYLLETVVREQIGALLKLDAHRIPSDTPLAKLGFTSLMGLTFRSRLAVGLGFGLPATLIFNYPTLEKLVPFLSEKLGLTSPAEKTLDPRPEPEAQPEIIEPDDLSEEEAEALLLAKIEAYERN